MTIDLERHVTTYMEFLRGPMNGTTSRWRVFNRRSSETLGEIRWYGPWRQYVFFPRPETLFNAGCLQDIIEFLGAAMTEWRARRPARAGHPGVEGAAATPARQ